MRKPKISHRAFILVRVFFIVFLFVGGASIYVMTAVLDNSPFVAFGILALATTPLVRGIWRSYEQIQLRGNAEADA